MVDLEINNTPLQGHCDLFVFSGNWLMNEQRLGIPRNIKSNQYNWIAVYK